MADTYLIVDLSRRMVLITPGSAAGELISRDVYNNRKNTCLSRLDIRASFPGHCVGVAAGITVFSYLTHTYSLLAI